VGLKTEKITILIHLIKSFDSQNHAISFLIEPKQKQCFPIMRRSGRLQVCYQILERQPSAAWLLCNRVTCQLLSSEAQILCIPLRKAILSARPQNLPRLKAIGGRRVKCWGECLARMADTEERWDCPDVRELDLETDRETYRQERESQREE